MFRAPLHTQRRKRHAAQPCLALVRQDGISERSWGPGGRAPMARQCSGKRDRSRAIGCGAPSVVRFAGSHVWCAGKATRSSGLAWDSLGILEARRNEGARAWEGNESAAGACTSAAHARGGAQCESERADPMAPPGGRARGNGERRRTGAAGDLQAVVCLVEPGLPSARLLLVPILHVARTHLDQRRRAATANHTCESRRKRART